MITDWQVLMGLRNALVNNLPDYMEEQEDASDVLVPLSEDQVVIDDYDIDNLPAKVSFFIVPSNGENTRETMLSDDSTLTVEMYCICKGLPKVDLVRQAQAYKACVEHMIGKEQTLGDLVDFIQVTDSNWYSGIESVGTAKGWKLTISVQWQKSY